MEGRQLMQLLAHETAPECWRSFTQPNEGCSRTRQVISHINGEVGGRIGRTALCAQQVGVMGQALGTIGGGIGKGGEACGTRSSATGRSNGGKRLNGQLGEWL